MKYVLGHERGLVADERRAECDRASKAGERIEDFDAAVAAHALAEGCVLVTANLKHMTRVAGLEVEDWSQGKFET
jgi:predicted nucleic acid-binding protein